MTMIVLLVILLITLVIGCATSEVTNIGLTTLMHSLPSQEWSALELLYNTTGGQNWKWDNKLEKILEVTFPGKPWNFTKQSNGNFENPCSNTNPWQGIRCTSPCGTTPCSVKLLDVSSLGLQGSIPSQISNLRYLVILDISHNEQLSRTTLTSITPYISVGYLPYLEEFKIGYSKQKGTIPGDLCTVTQLRKLELQVNQLTGTIPECIGNNLTGLHLLRLNNNRLLSTIPPSFGNLENLLVIQLAANPIYGPLPDELSQLRNLNILSAPLTMLTSSIPESYFLNMVNLTVMNLYYTHISGSLSNNIGILTKLTTLGLFCMQLTGTIPSTIGDLSNLNQIGLYNNDLSGTIPKSLGNLKRLKGIALGFNLLSGSLPGELFQPENELEAIYVNYNNLEGSIPVEIGNLQNLQVISFGSNYLTGMLPAGFCGKAMTDISVNENLLDGTIPECYGQMDLLKNFDAGLNYLMGALPDFISTKLRQFIVSNNLFEGKIQTGSEWKNIGSVDFSDNLFTGTVPILPTKALRAYYLNNNAFTGIIPDGLFESAKVLSIFVASINCFHGILPRTLCNARNITSLEMDGLSSSNLCSRRVSMFGTPISLNGVYGSIDNCLFSLPKLSIVRLSGNQFSGEIKNVSTISPKFTELQLSSNAIRGKIPSFIWSGNFSTLDLSFNRFDGSIDSTYNPSPNATVYLQRNQLSGNLPRALDNLRMINILEGNIFACKEDRSDLPHYDPSSLTYNCGSNSLNNAIYIWIGLTFGCVCLCLIVYYRVKEYVTEIINLLKKWWELGSNPAHHALPFWLETIIQQMLLHPWTKRFSFAFAILLLCCMVVFSALSSIFGYFEHQYGWVITAAYNEGLPSTIVLLIIYALMLVSLFGLLYVALSARELADIIKRSVSRGFGGVRAVEDPTKHLRRLKSVSLLLVNVTIVLVVNIAYVFSINQSYSFIAHQVIGVALSAFKIFWSAVVVSRFGVLFNEQVIIAISIFNNIVAPYIAEMLRSPDCFWYLVNSPPLLNSNVNDLKCRTYTLCFSETCNSIVECYSSKFRIAENPIQVSYIPPFKYSYTCSSSVLTTFSAVFIYRYVFSGILVPVWLVIAKHIQQYFQITLRSKDGSKWSFGSLLVLTIPVLWRPLWESTNTDNRYIDDMEDNSQQLKLERCRRAFLVPLITDVAVLVSLGLAIPPLGLLISVSVVTHIVMFVLSIGRLLDLESTVTHDFRKDEIRIMIEKLGQVYKGWSMSCKRGLHMIIAVAASSWGFLLFDTLGYQYGMHKALYIPCVAASLPICIFLCYLGFARWFRTSPNSFSIDCDNGDDDIVNKEFELTTMSGASALYNQDNPIHASAITQ